ncbi:hypothetical protein [Salinimicrobium oceani]|uniref:Outer membrane protein beta-barrel domain-containing protein n=1 Tax=Salinimicrobium oceani TaxID=2722702 RepID=A0ABX1CXU2_9FLAO|nr:hypothetical protein [Salinimicrobium oceani]NJW53074.1 hypothetical protein [Salinimicrobium oceani]
MAFLIVFSKASYAQADTPHAFYSSAEFDLGNYIGLDLNLNYVYHEQLSFKMGYSGHVRKARSKPADYSSGLVDGLFFGLLSPYDTFENFQAGMGKIFKLNESGTIRLNFSLGLGYTTIEEPGNWETSGGGIFVENYTWSYHKYNTISFIVNPKIEIPFSRFFGFTISPVVQISKDRIYYGIGFGEMMGLLRKRKTSASQ